MKKLCSFLIFLLCVGLLFGCGTVGDSTNENSLLETQKQQIADVFHTSQGKTIYWKSGSAYVGAYGESHVFYVQGDASGELVHQVGEYTFRHEYGAELWVYNNEKVYPLYNAFAQKILTDEQLAALYGDYQTWEKPSLKTESSLQGDCPELSAQRLQAVNALWSAQTGKTMNWDGKDGYLGTYGQCVIVFSSGQLTVMSAVQVADYLFTCGSSFRIYAFTSDAMLDLRDAYEQDLVTYEDIGRIFAVYAADNG